jgi:DMSO/TMAO reductase YedYZ molybdopterin-dependent catalytic subunit
MGTQEKFDELPVMPVHSPPAWSSLEIRGTVGKHLDLVLNDLLLMPQSTFTADFECNDGWISPEQEWEGVPVRHILRQAEVAMSAQKVEFHSGERCQILTIEEALDSTVMIALRLNGKPLPAGNGGPCRLVAGARKGPAHVKWLQAMNVT